MLTESIVLKGNLDVVLLDENNQVKDSRKINNLVVTTGKNFIAQRMTANTTNIMSHMAIGSGTNGAGLSNTALITEITRVALTSSTITNGNTISFVGNYPAGTGTGTITESGIFNASSGGSMLCRTTFGAVTKGAADTLVITWNVTVQ